MAYPTSLDSYTPIQGISLVASADHANQHNVAGSAIVNIETTIGTTSGTAILKDFTAGQFAARVNSGGTLVQVLTGGTINNPVMGTPAITGGTATSQTLTNPVLQGAIDGWTLATDTWTYASASTITVPSGAASIYQKGDRIKFTQTTVKYATIVAVADTLLTIAVNTDYVVANAAITLNYYSHQVNPLGYPTLFTYAGVIYGAAGTAGTYAETVHICKFSIVGNQMFVHVTKNITNVGSWSGAVQMTLPVTPSSEYSATASSFVNCYATANGAVPGAGSLACLAIEDDNAFGTFVKQINTAALAWADVAGNCVVHGDFSYYF